MTDHELHARLRVFRDAGLLAQIPTLFQIHQGELEMAPYVTSTDATCEAGYAGAPLGHPVVRQPIVFSQVGLDHLRVGSALGAKLGSLCAHLQLTFHQGMPVFDLQAVMTHPGGLAHLRRGFEDLLTGATPHARRRRRIASLLFAAPDAYFARFLGDDGWIARAERLDFPSASEQGSAFPPEFFSLVGFLEHCAATFPARPGDLPASRWPAHLYALVSRRFREGRGFGWFAARGRAGAHAREDRS
jgi:hypothetical protein